MLYLSGIQAYTFPGDYLSKEWNAGTSEKTFIFVKFHICLPAYHKDPVYHCIIALWSLPCSMNATIRMSSAMPKSFGIPVSNTSILFWNMSLACVTLNGNCLYPHLPNIQENELSVDY